MAVTSSFFCPRDGHCSFWYAFFSQVTMETSWTCQCRPRRLLRHQQTPYLMEATITSCHGMILNRVVM